jgi:hypothetical protein
LYKIASVKLKDERDSSNIRLPSKFWMAVFLFYEIIPKPGANFGDGVVEPEFRATKGCVSLSDIVHFELSLRVVRLDASYEVFENFGASIRVGQSIPVGCKLIFIYFY